MDFEKLLRDTSNGVLAFIFQGKAQGQTADPDAQLKNCAAEVIHEQAPVGAKISRERHPYFGDVFGYLATGPGKDFSTGAIFILPGNGGPGSLFTQSLQDDGRHGSIVGLEADKRYLERPARSLSSILYPLVNKPDMLDGRHNALRAAGQKTSSRLLDGMRHCMAGGPLIS